MNTPLTIDVFLSRKSQDAPLAKTLYDFLTAKGLKVFDSEYSLPELGNADYQRAIDQALETCTHMIVVGSSAENICSSWVDAEWRLFINEKRAGYKTGNILTIVTPDIVIRSLPASLRYYEVIVLEQRNYERIYAYVKQRKLPVPISIQPVMSSSLITSYPKLELSLLLLALTLSTEATTEATQLIKQTTKVVIHWHTKGENYYENKDFEKAVIYFSKAAEQGNADSQYCLGRCYYFGHGVLQEYRKAVEWYHKAAKQGKAFAQLNLGVCYHNGHGVKQDYAEAFRWFRKAAEQNDDFAQFNLGRCYYFGHGVQEDYAEAFKWFHKAAERGHANAQYLLGACYYLGQGVQQDYSEALRWFRKAVEQDEPNAQYNLGVCYHNGHGVKQDHIEAVRWYTKAVEQDQPDAQYNLGWCFEAGTGVVKDKKKARYWYTKASEGGRVNARDRLKSLGNNSFWSNLFS